MKKSIDCSKSFYIGRRLKKNNKHHCATVSFLCLVIIGKVQLYILMQELNIHYI